MRNKPKHSAASLKKKSLPTSTPENANVKEKKTKLISAEVRLGLPYCVQEFHFNFCLRKKTEAGFHLLRPVFQSPAVICILSAFYFMRSSSGDEVEPWDGWSSRGKLQLFLQPPRLQCHLQHKGRRPRH